MNKKFGKDILMQGIARIFGGFISFVSILVLTYIFDERELGRYNLILGAINVITSLSTLWLSQSILRFYNKKNQIGFVFILTLLCIALSLVVYSLLSIITNYQNSIWVFIYIAMLVLYNILDALFRKARKLENYVALELSFSIGKVFPMLIIYKIIPNYNCIFISSSLAIMLLLFIILIKEKETIIKAKYTFDFIEFRKYIKYGLPLAGLSISNWFLSSSDRYIIKYYESEAQVGVYSMNYSLANSIYMMFCLILINAMHPIIINEWEKDKVRAIEIVSKTVEYYFLLMIPLTFYGCLKSKSLLSFYKGQLYADKNSIFIWTVLGIFVYGLSLLYHKYYECTKESNNILRINIECAVFNVISNLFMVPRFGYEICSFTTFLSYVLYLLIVHIRVKNNFPITIDYALLLKTILPNVCFFLIDFLFFKSNSIAEFFIEGFIYVIFTLLYYKLTKLFDIKSLFKKN